MKKEQNAGRCPADRTMQADTTGEITAHEAKLTVETLCLNRELTPIAHT